MLQKTKLGKKGIALKCIHVQCRKYGFLKYENMKTLKNDL